MMDINKALAIVNIELIREEIDDIMEVIVANVSFGIKLNFT